MKKFGNELYKNTTADKLRKQLRNFLQKPKQ